MNKTTIFISIALAGLAASGFAQDKDPRGAALDKLGRALEAAKEERFRIEERIFALAWRIQELNKNKDLRAAPELPEVKLAELPEGHSWTRSGYFTGSVFIVDAKGAAAGFETARLEKTLSGRFRNPAEAASLPEGVHELGREPAKLASGKTFKLIIAVYADERNTHYARPLVVVRDGHIDVRVRTWRNDLMRSMDYRPRLISQELAITVERAGVYAVDIGEGAAGRIEVP